GRHAGWMTAACALAAEREGDAPHVLLLPELPFHEERFLKKVQQAVERYGYCVIAVSEGIKRPDGEFLSASGVKDAFGHTQLGGVAPVITNLIAAKLGHKCHWAVADYLQRSAPTLPRKPTSSRPTPWVARRWNLQSPEETRSCPRSGGSAIPRIVGTLSRRPSRRWPTRRNSCLPNSSALTASASPTQLAAIWHR